MPGKMPHLEDRVGNQAGYNPKELDILLQHEGDVTVVVFLVDSITAANAASFKAQLLPLCTPQARIVLDMGGVRFVDSAGIGALMSCLKTLKSMKGSMKICQVTSPVIALFNLVRLDRLLDIHASKEEAMESFS